jgi:hypothetical protein
MTRLPMDYEHVTQGPDGQLYRVTCPYCGDGLHISGLESAFAWGRDHADTQHPEPRP